MTEAEWLCCEDPTPMLEFVKSTASDRKLRLFACACCRRIMHLFTDKSISRKTIEFAERFADGQATKNELHGNAWGKPGQAHSVVHRKAWDAAEECSDYGADKIATSVQALDKENFTIWRAAFDAALLQYELYDLSESLAIANASVPPEWVALGRSANKEERKKQTLLIRDIFGNPFRPVTVDPSWRTSTVVQLAQVIYQERSFDRMEVLADSLEEAGCTDLDIFKHCRQEAEHVRGCWVLDLLLGKK